MNQDRQKSRRDFLRGNKAVNMSRDNQKVDAPPNQSGYLEQYTKPAMACQFEIMLNMRQYPNGPQAVNDGFELLDLLEDQLTIYREHSEVSKLNRSAIDRPTPVETRLFRLLDRAQQITEGTNNAFDITSSALTELWGFDKRSGAVPAADDIKRVLQCVGSENIQLDRECETVQFSDAETKINLGGIGKGYAIDRMSELFRERSINDFIIHGGQSSVLARGSQDQFSRSEAPHANDAVGIESGDQSANLGWKVGLSHPTVPDFRLAEFTLRDQALGTSGTGRQGFFHQGKRYGHIIDPRTGWPTDHVLSSTVISPSAALSDALATAFFVMKLDQVEAYCQAHPDVAALLIVPGKSKGQIKLEWFNLAGSQWKQLV